MSEGSSFGVPKEILEELSRMKMVEFRPCFAQLPRLDQLVILQENCFYTEETAPGSAIGILKKNHGEDAGKVVGVVIHGYSRWKHD
ncbi:MAG: hypothetical protein A2431_00905 [Candidatus Zambryskibacteria bacterium RIFOXYC1_FULL_39_10]|uniref:Uncharacterized protein n=1 Tax=Candidatus Zambryskibacteria bacterium RIFOXYC1_FULL_39_10 TaxID=1802779 RepID=A0A1G2V2G4_9BACT|nr:MAG: hypothetical protein A2431_00905 [Candidatus Zambryskibacteria bacterium RIFOXYC1_FULL_39_10]OHB16859.1 MAG: hypothetical protein A2605_00115 [Candidatus Zambryskibacteria bacterium RIFOXYD1_FULL_39_35]